jgi:peptidoglycan/LPS O-acetylase OafA/YrhL
MEMLARKLRTLRAERVVEVDPPRRHDPRAGAERLSRGWAVTLPLAWALIFSSAAAVEPPPAHPNAPEPLIGVLLGMMLFAAWTVMVVGIAGRRPVGAWGSLAAGVTMLAAAIACPVSGHHQSVGLWWFYELAGAAVLIALSLRAIPRRLTKR